MQERYEEAETFFENATCIDEKSILAWTTLGQQLLHVVILIVRPVNYVKTPPPQLCKYCMITPGKSPVFR